MSKVICDVCGTSYSDTATQCPICGSVRQGDSLVSNQSSQDVGGYTYVKGGRFSKNNVKKRNQGTSGKQGRDSGKDRKSTGLIIVLVLLILIVLIMIAVILFGLLKSDDGSDDVPQLVEPQNVACTGLSLSQDEITLESVGAQWMLYTSLTPSNTTDKVIFTSADPEIATVSENGSVVCVSAGSTTITVRCGDQEKICRVNCVLPTEETQQPTVAPEGIHLNRMSILADFLGFEWTLYSGKIPVSDIDWSSDNPNVASFVDGVVTAKGEGETTVYAEYNGVITSCTIICDFDAGTENGNGEQPPTIGADLKIYSQYGSPLQYNEEIQAYDVMISVGESLALYLKDSNGMTAEVTWSIVEGSSCEFDGEYFTATDSSSNCMVEAEFNGVIYRCLIRTRN